MTALVTIAKKYCAVCHARELVGRTLVTGVCEFCETAPDLCTCGAHLETQRERAMGLCVSCMGRLR